MKIEEVPQDPKDFKEGSKMKKLLYAVDDDGNYVGKVSAGWVAENEAMRQAWDLVDEALEDTLNKVKTRKLSPIAWFMQKNLMDISLLAKYMHLWQWQVKRHFKPANFINLKQETLQAYAKVFNVTIDDLKNFNPK